MLSNIINEKPFAMMVLFTLIKCKEACNRQVYIRIYQNYTSVPTNIGNGMEEINLSHNEISLIDDESFNETATDFIAVRTLQLPENRIENVSDGAFAGFQNLIYI